MVISNRTEPSNDWEIFFLFNINKLQSNTKICISASISIHTSTPFCLNPRHTQNTTLAHVVDRTQIHHPQNQLIIDFVFVLDSVSPICPREPVKGLWCTISCSSFCFSEAARRLKRLSGRRSDKTDTQFQSFHCFHSSSTSGFFGYVNDLKKEDLETDFFNFCYQIHKLSKYHAKISYFNY